MEAAWVLLTVLAVLVGMYGAYLVGSKMGGNNARTETPPPGPTILPPVENPKPPPEPRIHGVLFTEGPGDMVYGNGVPWGPVTPPSTTKILMEGGDREVRVMDGIRGDLIITVTSGNPAITIQGEVGGEVRVDKGNLTCGDIHGDVSVAGDVTCTGDINQGITDCKGSVQCRDVTGDVTAKGDVTCTEIGGSIEQARDVTCTSDGGITGDVIAGGNVTCRDVGGSITCKGNVYCRNVDQGIEVG